LFSDRYARLFSLYSLDKNLRICITPESPVINFHQLKTLLLSKDPIKFGELEMLTSNGCKLLDEKVLMAGNRVAFTSYPRSGNSFLRKILEQVTGIFSGSDLSLDNAIPFQ